MKAGVVCRPERCDMARFAPMRRPVFRKVHNAMSLRFLLLLTILGAVACSSPSTGAGSPTADSGSPQPDASNGDAEAPRDTGDDNGGAVHDAGDAGHVATGDVATG